MTPDSNLVFMWEYWLDFLKKQRQILTTLINNLKEVSEHSVLYQAQKTANVVSDSYQK